MLIHGNFGISGGKGSEESRWPDIRSTLAELKEAMSLSNNTVEKQQKCSAAIAALTSHLNEMKGAELSNAQSALQSLYAAGGNLSKYAQDPSDSQLLEQAQADAKDAIMRMRAY